MGQPLSASHNRTVLSVLPEVSRCPSGLNATLRTWSVCPELELIDTAHAAAFTVVLHALLIPEELAVQRVRHRVNAGGHDVPEDKIRQRYQRLWALVATAITRCDSATVFDNSALKGPRIVAQMSGGQLIGAPTWPAWSPQVLSSR